MTAPDRESMSGCPEPNLRRLAEQAGQLLARDPLRGADGLQLMLARLMRAATPSAEEPRQ